MMRSRAGMAIIVALGGWVIRLLAATWRVRRTNDGGWRGVTARGGNMVFAVWHGELLAPVWYHRGERVVALVSEHRDGELIARIIERLGFGTVRGSTTRGAARALLAVIRRLEEGDSIAITPDGPKGPRHVFQAGALAAAQRARVPIIAVGTAMSRAWQFGSWDRFVVPKPFARVSIAYSDPVFVREDARSLDDLLPEFEARMRDVTDAAVRALHDG